MRPLNKRDLDLLTVIPKSVFLLLNRILSLGFPVLIHAAVGGSILGTVKDLAGGSAASRLIRANGV